MPYVNTLYMNNCKLISSPFKQNCNCTRTCLNYITVIVMCRYCGMQVLQYLRYCNTSGSLTPLPCRVVNHCLVV